jgi:hypothetical protein
VSWIPVEWNGARLLTRPGKAKTEGELGFGVAVLVAQGHQGSQPGGYQPGEHWLAPWRQGRKRLLCQLPLWPPAHRISSKLPRAGIVLQHMHVL